jgi:hypothetical protein
LFEKKLVERAAEEGEKQERKSKRKEAKMWEKNFQRLQLNESFSKKQMKTLNVIEYARFPREEPNVVVRSVMMIVKICIMN